MRSDARKETEPAGQAAARECPHCGSSCAPEHQYCPTCGFPVATVGVGNDDRLIGRTLPGGYHILDLISVGGMGRVYRAEQSALGRTVAVKIIHPHLLSDESSGLRFMTEARAASQLNHPNSLSVFDFGRTDDGQPYLVMEFLRGRDLARVDYEEGPLGFTRIADVLCQVLSALAEAHELGIVHRDLKPENVVLEPLRRGGDFVKVVDFGLAKLRADTQAPGVTNPGIVCGTPDYMAPEQGRGDPIDGRSDLYAVGVILFQLLTGRLPFVAESPTKVVILHITAPIPDPREIAPQRHIPESFVEVVKKALSKKVADRYQDAFEFSDALKGAVATIVPQPSDAPRALHGFTTTRCTACGLLVPYIKFCGECGARLPGVRSQRPGLEFPLPFVGRDQELAFLQQARHGARGQVAGACLVGEAGSGKTRLLREFAAFAEDEGDRVAFTGPDRFRAEVGYQALRDAVTGLTGLRAGDVDRLPPNTGDDVRAALAEVFAWPISTDPRSPEERRGLAANALRWALDEAGGGERRVLLVVDDLDQIDGASRNALGDVLGSDVGGNMLILTAHRRGFDRGWRGGRVAVHVLGGLSPSAVGRLLGPEGGGAHLEVPGGALPMYVEQVARYTFEGGTSPPARLADLVALRIDMLDLDARRVLQVVAILGDRTSRSAVIEILPRMDRLDEALEALARRGMVDVSGDDLGVSQPLLREIVLSGIPGAVRRELHEKCLNAADRLGMPSEARALHAYEAGESFQALLLLEQMANRARGRGDVESEVFALRRGLMLARQEISRGELDDPLRAVLIFSEKLGTCLTRLGSYVDAEGVLREALDLLDPNSADRARLLGALAHVAQGRNRAHEANDYVEQALAIARRTGAADLVTSLTEARQSWTQG